MGKRWLAVRLDESLLDRMERMMPGASRTEKIERTLECGLRRERRRPV